MPRATINSVVTLLKKKYPYSKSALHFKSSLELLVATILSAQCTDKQVNIVTGSLFKKYKTAEDYAKADLTTFEREIRSIGLYRNKAKNIIGSAKKILNDFKGRVPDSMPDLLKLPGVARKTANIVLFGVFGKTEGIAVDTHVRRVTQRLGLTTNKNPEKIEQDLMQILPRKDWGVFNYILVQHGRDICLARNPRCLECIVSNFCPSKKVFISGKISKAVV